MDWMEIVDFDFGETVNTVKKHQGETQNYPSDFDLLSGIMSGTGPSSSANHGGIPSYQNQPIPRGNIGAKAPSATTGDFDFSSGIGFSAGNGMSSPATNTQNLSQIGFSAPGTYSVPIGGIGMAGAKYQVQNNPNYSMGMGAGLNMMGSFGGMANNNAMGMTGLYGTPAQGPSGLQGNSMTQQQQFMGIGINQQYLVRQAQQQQQSGYGKSNLVSMNVEGDEFGNFASVNSKRSRLKC